MADSDDEREEVLCCYSVGSFGPFPISFYRESGKCFYEPLEHSTIGPYDSLEQAIEAAELDFALADGGFWKTLGEAKKHATRMRKNGYGFD